MWVATQGGLTRFLRKPPAFVNYKHEPGIRNSLSNSVVWSVQEDSKGSGARMVSTGWIGAQGSSLSTGAIPKIRTAFLTTRSPQSAKTCRAPSGLAPMVGDLTALSPAPDNSSPIGMTKATPAAWAATRSFACYWTGEECCGWALRAGV
jgi:hypothetical protein